MAQFRMYNCECDAQELDAAWVHLLARERKIKANVGDYLVTCLDGREEIWEKQRFEALFYKL